MKSEKSIFDSLQEEIMQSELPESEKNQRLSHLLKASARKINLMLIGASGVGKSSTINALFDMSVAGVGFGVDPETREIVKYELGNLTIWDSPGLGDTVQADKAHIEQIVKKLSEYGEDGSLLIDLVLIVLDASSKDLSVSFDLINNTLIPCLGQDNAHRILIGLNQSDMAMKGRYWDHKSNKPQPTLHDFLIQKAESIKLRIREATGVTVEPVYYSAGYTDGIEKQNPYNLSKLLYHILRATPSEKRLVLVDKLNSDESNWTFNDRDYSGAVQRSFLESLLSSVFEGAELGATIGSHVIGVPGLIVGGLIGAITGSLYELVVKPISNLNPLDKLKPLSRLFDFGDK